MAKRRRKMTLFDVIERGQPIGLSVRNRVPTYKPTPELPIQKKIARLLGRSRPTDASRPLTAADELDRLRRELAGSEPTAADVPVRPAAREDVEPVEPAPLSAAERARSKFQIAEPVADETPATITAEPAAPREPRRRLSVIISEAARKSWTAAEPSVQAIASRSRDLGARGLVAARGHLATAREWHGRYAVTTLAAAAVVVLLCGSFYAGKLLFNRPSADPTSTGVALADGGVRPDVLDVAARPNEAIANVDAGATKVVVERNAEQRPANAPTDAAVFGGRRLDINYLIIQKYDTQAEADAAVEVLNKYGVKTSVETNLPRWSKAGRPGFYVVSRQGFAKMGGNAEYAAFVMQIAKISDREAGQTLPRRLDPLPYRYEPQP